MIKTEIVATIPGDPAPKGSLKCIGGRGGRHVLVEDNKRTKPWRQTLVGWFRKIKQHADPGQPIGVEMTATLRRPASHYGTGRNAGLVKGSAPNHPTGHNTGDSDKLLRLVCDALQDAKVLVDDCQVVEVTSRKCYPLEVNQDSLTGVPDALRYPGVRVRIYPVGGGS